MRTPLWFPTLHTYRGLSLTRPLLYRIAVLAKCLMIYATALPSLVRCARGLRKERNKHAGGQALIIAGGPSARLLDADKVVRFQAEGGIVYVVNSYYRSEFARAVTPDYYVLADPEYFLGAECDRESAPDTFRVWDYISETQVVPAFPALAEPPVAIKGEAIRFVNVGLQGWTKNIDPRLPRGYSSMVAMNTLALALYHGHRCIYAAGIDNDMFKHLYRDAEGKLRHSGGTHHHPIDMGDAEAGQACGTNLYRGGIAAYFENVARIFDELRLFPRNRIRTVDRSSLVDAFEVIDDRGRRLLLNEPRTKAHE